jgi:hypothetical protein
MLRRQNLPKVYDGLTSKNFKHLSDFYLLNRLAKQQHLHLEGL